MTMSIEERAFIELLCAARAITRALEGEVSVVEMLAMAILKTDKTRNMKSLSISLGLAPSSTTALVDRLVESGHVERVVNPDNRRSIEVSLSPSGKKFFDELVAKKREANTNLFADASAQELAAFYKVLRTFNMKVAQQIFKD